MTPISNSIPQDPSSSNNRVSLKHALIVVDYYTDPKIRGLNFRYGAIAELLDVRLACCISKSPDAAIDYDTAYSVAADLGLRDQAVEIVQYMIDKGILLIRDGFITKDSVIKDSEKCAKRREESAERQREKREKEQLKIKQRLKEGFVTRDNRVTDHVTPDTDTVSVYDPDNDPYLILKGNPPDDVTRSSTYANTLPESLDTPEIRKALANWLYKQTQLHKPRDQMAIEALVANWSNRPKDFLHALRESTANGWKTLIEPKATAGPPAQKKEVVMYKKETNHERNMRILQGA